MSASEVRAIQIFSLLLLLLLFLLLLLPESGRERSTGAGKGRGLTTYGGLKTANGETTIVTEIEFVLIVTLTETVVIGVVIETAARSDVVNATNDITQRGWLPSALVSHIADHGIVLRQLIN